MTEGYSETAAGQLDRLNVEAPEPLWNAIVEALDLIFDHDQSLALRRQRLIGEQGRSTWMLKLPGDDNIAILWSEHDGAEVIDWVGEWPPG